MKAKIDEMGYLHIERHGKMRHQFCPTAFKWMWCGTWCPLFGEWRKSTVLQDGTDKNIILQLCKTTLILDELIVDGEN